MRYAVRMDSAISPRAAVPARFLLSLMLPFGLPILLTFALLLLVGEAWPRQVAPGSGLKLAGLAATVLTGLACWRVATRVGVDRTARRFAALLAMATALMGWPVWTVGLLPSVNGAVLTDPRSALLRFDRVEATRRSKSRELNHWVWLGGDRGLGTAPSRYVIPKALYDRWRADPPPRVRVETATGLLGADVVTGFR